MTCYKISMLYQVTSNDRLISKTQMGTGYTTGFLCVIFKICLYILICMVTNDLNGILICTNSTIGSKPPELTAYSAWCCYLDLISYWKRSKGKVIIDTYCKVVTVKWFLGSSLSSSSNTATICAGVVSLMESP